MPKIVRRAGIDGVNEFRGMNREKDPASISADQFYTLQNARWKGGAIVERGGQSTLLGSALSPALVTGIYDSSIGGSLVGGTSGGGGGGGPIGTGGGGGGGGTPGTGDGPKVYWNFGGVGTSYVLFHDDEKSGGTYSNNVFEIDTSIAQATDGGGACIAATQWIGRLWWLTVSTANDRWALYYQNPVYGTNFTQPIRVTPLISPGVDMVASLAYMTSWRGKLYFTLTMTAGSDNPITYEFDGTTLKQFDNSGFTAAATGQPIGYNDKLFVVHSTANNVIRYISIAGTGANATMPGAAFSTVGGFDSAVEYKGTLYVGGVQTGSTSIILSTTTTTFAAARDLQATVSATSAPRLFVFNGYLYYLWSTAGPVRYRLGRFDGTTWTDTHKDFGAGVTDCPNGRFFTHKGNLCMLSNSGGAVTPAWKSAGTDTTTWTAMQSSSAAGRERMDSNRDTLVSFA